MESTKADWSSLDHDLLSLVLEKLPSHQDYLHFHVVCKPWHDVSARQMDQRIRYQARNIPFLLVPTRDGSENERGLYNLVNNKNLNFQVSLPFNLRCCGSSHGWLLFNSKTSFTMLNPIIDGKTLHLPPVRLDLGEDDIESSEEDEDDIELESSKEDEDDTESHGEESDYPFHPAKAVLSCDPSLNPNDYEVLVIYGGMCKLAIFRAGDTDWTPIEDHPSMGVFDDVIYHKDAFYAIDYWMGVGRITDATCAKRKTQSIDKKDSVVMEIAEGDIPVRSYKIVMVIPRLLSINTPVEVHSNFLVELSNEELVCALRIMDDKEGESDIPQGVTSGFRVYRLVNSNQVEQNIKQWVEIDTLGDDALFLGDNHSAAVNVNQITGYEKNSIYYTDNNALSFNSYGQLGPRDVGVFHLENQSMKYHYELDAAHRHMPPAIWFSPSLQACTTV